jgi:hypothetical protein
MGIQHDNEKYLEYGLIADIYIPPTYTATLNLSNQNNNSTHNSISNIDSIDPNSNNINSTNTNSKGIIIEVDGLHHFESYLLVSSLIYIVNCIVVLLFSFIHMD